MAKSNQSLGDMVRQEAIKVTASEVETTPTENQSKSQSQETETPSSSTRRKTLTKADLEALNTELKSALETAHEHKKTLQEQVLNLQTELVDKDKKINQLQEEFEQTDLKGKFEQATKTVLQLSEKNTQLIQEIETFKQENQALKAKLEELEKPAQVKPAQIQRKLPTQKVGKPHMVPRPEHAQTQPESVSDDFSQSTWLL